ncbi:uncharacterized protein LOC126372706 [Pectinophora gossypiella]|uniref:uncharacterized protein LOC126372706 n=1 Tax=Pectinophora gossypiella TaxID=13191 RepID=UPI00214F08F6|nr:uncharacterized protein LOC126372706 [Pectinophora gossypiella]
MFGIRTPMKKVTETEAPSPQKSPQLTEKAGPSQPNQTAVPSVRRSIGEWESGANVGRKKSVPLVPSGPRERMPLSQETRPSERRASVESTKTPPPKPKYNSRMSEAKACLVKAKTLLGESRNLKAEIKQGVTQAVERLYQLAKEAGGGKDQASKIASEHQGGGDEAQGGNPETPQTDLMRELITNLKEHKNVLQDCSAHSRALSKDIRDARSNAAEQRPSYAEIARLTKSIEDLKTNLSDQVHPQPTQVQAVQQPKHDHTAPMHTIIVTSDDKEESGQEVITKIRQALDAKNTGIRVDRLRKARDQKVVLGCHSKHELEKVSEAVKSRNLTVKEAHNKNPLVILRDVLSVHTDEDIVKALKNQNAHLLADIKEVRIAVRYRRRARNPHVSHVVIEVSPMVWQRLTAAGRVHIDLQRVRVEDRSPLVQCSLCLGYGHTKRLCKDTVEKCSYCGGPHKWEECADRLPEPLQHTVKGDADGQVARSAGAPPGVKSYRVFQANLQRKELATNELMLEANKIRAAFALLQEPYVGSSSGMKAYRGARIFQNTGQEEGTVKAAIAVFDQDMDIVQYPELTTNNILVVRIRTSAWEMVVISCYFEPDQPIEPYLEQLKGIRRKLQPKLFLIGGDVNAKNTWWGSSKIDCRGSEVSGAMEEMEMQVLNEGDVPTFDTIRGNKRYASHVDITACSSDMLGLVEDWRVDERITSSDHNTITFKVRLARAKGTDIQRTTRVYGTKRANWIQFHEKLKQLVADGAMDRTKIEGVNTIRELDFLMEEYTNIVKKTCEDTLSKKKPNQKLTLPWMSEELDKLKKEVLTRKRRVRCAAPVRRARVVAEYLQMKEMYERDVKKAQISSWKDFCGKQDREGVWEGIYRVIGRTAKRQEDLPLEIDGRTVDMRDSARALTETFYPEDSADRDTAYHRHIRAEADRVSGVSRDESRDPPFTMEELRAAVESFNPKKAPGADGFTADICSRAISCDPGLFLSLVNKCLELEHFPTIWKKATVVVLRKPGKDNYRIPKAYRPIGLLPVMGKIFEKLIVGRLKWHILPRISTRQYGFMPQKSTEDSLYDLVNYIRQKIKAKKLVTLVSLDIEGAFDNAWWPAIRVRLAEEKCPANIRRVLDSYLRDRQVTVRYGGEQYTKATTKGCVQGSIGGPILWNLLLDPLLKGLEERGDYVQAFADDVVLVFHGETALEVGRQANAALAYVQDWGMRNKLNFGPQKTKAMLLTNKLKYDTPILDMGGISIEMSNDIKILGLHVDRKLTFNKHISEVCKKAIAIYKQLSRAAKVDWGLHPEIIRLIYNAAIEPVILYASSVWASEADKLGVQKQLNNVQRGFAQKLTKAYRTVSLNSALVLSGLLPLDLRVKEAAALYEAKRGVPQPMLGDREVERVVGYAQAPHPATHMKLEFVCLVDQEQVDCHNNQAVRIYTDGSKIDGKVGAALSVWDGDAETKTVKLKLSPYCTVYQAELLAICEATRVILACHQTSFGIYSDSRSALETIVNHDAKHHLAVRTRKNLAAGKLQNKEISLFWIKAHAGLEGNERADQLAKDAAQRVKTKPNYDLCPVSYLKRQIRIESLEKWNERYRAGTTASTTKLFFPDATMAYKIVKKLELTGVLTQVLTGHGGFSGYLNRFKCKEDPSCICEPGVEETVAHLLFECPTNGPLRYDVEQMLETTLCRERASEILADKTSRAIFIKYCQIVANRAIKRNKEQQK